MVHLPFLVSSWVCVGFYSVKLGLNKIVLIYKINSNSLLWGAMTNQKTFRSNPSCELCRRRGERKRRRSYCEEEAKDDNVDCDDDSDRRRRKNTWVQTLIEEIRNKNIILRLFLGVFGSRIY